MPDENIHDVSQSDILLNENATRNSFINNITSVQGPRGDDNKIKLWKAWTMEMLMNDSNIFTATMNRLEQSRGFQEVPVCQGHTLKSCNTVQHATDHGATRGS